MLYDCHFTLVAGATVQEKQKISLVQINLLYLPME